MADFKHKNFDKIESEIKNIIKRKNIIIEDNYFDISITSIYRETVRILMANLLASLMMGNAWG